MNIGEIIREARLTAGLTQAQLAEKAGMVQPAIARLENGKMDPTIRTLIRIANALGKKVELV
jgi:transcriptional regulator with XRE-family HTH domain